MKQGDMGHLLSSRSQNPPGVERNCLIKLCAWFLHTQHRFNHLESGSAAQYVMMAIIYTDPDHLLSKNRKEQTAQDLANIIKPKDRHSKSLIPFVPPSHLRKCQRLHSWSPSCPTPPTVDSACV